MARDKNINFCKEDKNGQRCVKMGSKSSIIWEVQKMIMGEKEEISFLLIRMKARAWVAKPDNLSITPQNHMMEGEN